MTITRLPIVLLTGICLLSSAYAWADEPPAEPLSVQVLPAQRTAVHVWPIMQGCRIAKSATDAVVRRLDADLSLEVHRLVLPNQPVYLTCTGQSCADLLSGDGCQPRGGMLIGGEVDEAPCDATDKTLAGCHGQLLSRIRVFRFDLEQNRPVRGDYRYALCEDHRCGAEGRSVEESVARLLDELVRTQSALPDKAVPRAAPEADEQCSAAANIAPPIDLPPAATVQPDLPAQAVLYAYYTQYKHLDNAPGGKYPTRDRAEQEAKQRSMNFSRGVSLPAGPQYVTTPVNSKYTLLPGESLAQNPARVSTLQGLLTKPPADAAFQALQKDPSKPRLMIALVFDDATKSLEALVLMAGKPLRPVPQPAACLAGGGESPACVAEIVRAAVTTAVEIPTWVVVPTPAARPALRPLGCLAYRERSCQECISVPALAAVPPPPAALPVAPPVDSTNPRKWTDGFLRAALGVSLATSVILSVADSATSATLLSNMQGETVSVVGLLRPAEWTAWGLTLVLAIPTAISVIEGRKAKPREWVAPPPVPQPSAPRCPIGEAP